MKKDGTVSLDAPIFTVYTEREANDAINAGSCVLFAVGFRCDGMPASWVMLTTETPEIPVTDRQMAGAQASCG